MALTKVVKIILSLGIILSVSAITIPVIINTVNNNNEIKFTYLYNAGVMIETRGMRIYIDPYNLSTSFEEFPADLILTTHNHGDHFQLTILNMLNKNSTEYIFPNYMSSYISLYDGIGVNPEDYVKIKHVGITAFYMYTFPVGEYPASHPKENNYTSYILDINGFTIFHAGDSKKIPEYNQLKGLIDLVLLPLGPGCQTMVDYEIVQALKTIEAKYFIPIHYGENACENFISTYGDYITEIQLIYLKSLQSIVF